MIGGAVMAFKTRNVRGPFRESTSTAIAVRSPPSLRNTAIHSVLVDGY